MTDVTISEKKTFKESVLRVIAVIGLVAILLLGAWGIIQIAFVLPDFFANTFSGSKTPAASLSQPLATESLTVTVPPATTSGQPFALSWNHQNKSTGAYGYQISYSCVAGLTLHAPVPTGGYQTVPCNTSFNFTNALETMQLTPTLSGSNPVPVTFTLFANRLSDGIVTAVGSTTTMLSPAIAAKPAVVAPVAPAKVTNKPTSTYVAAPRRSSLYGSPDLAVKISSAQTAGGRSTLQFTVINVGTNVSAAGWTFTASLPLNPVYTYVSQPQQGLYPGDSIVYTLGFNAPSTSNVYQGSGCTYPNYTYNSYNYPTNCGNTYSGNATYYGSNQYAPQYGRTVSVTVDPQNYLSDFNRTNNFASAQI